MYGNNMHGERIKRLVMLHMITITVSYLHKASSESNNV